MNRKAGRQAGRQADRRTDRYRQTDRQVERDIQRQRETVYRDREIERGGGWEKERQRNIIGS